MLSKFLSALDERERKLRYSFGDDITDPAERRKSKWHYNLFDHAFLRAVWTNFYPVSKDVWRSNQPTHKRFIRYRDMGIRSVINLRGSDPRAHYLFEEESCRILGLELHNCQLFARRAAEGKNILEAIELMRTVKKPMMFHCKSGADRAGFCAAVYQIMFDGKSVDEARKQLSLKFMHVKKSKTGVQDYILRVYKARLERGDIKFDEWIATEYDSNVIQQGFESKTPPEQMA